MESPERKVIYRQGFRSSEPVTDMLNSFIKTPRANFTLFSKAEFTHPPFTAIKYDDQANKPKEERIREINDRFTDLDFYSRNLAVRTIHLSLPANGTEDNRGLLLRFSPLRAEAATYWKIVQELKTKKRLTPDELARLTAQDIYVGLPARELRPKANVTLAKRTLAYALNDPARRYDFGVENILGLTKSEIDATSLARKQQISHPDIINEDEDAV